MEIFGLFILALATSNLGTLLSSIYKNGGNFNVMDYGAASDGQTDDSKAFLKAWNAACNDASSSVRNPKVIVPQGKKFLVNPIIFQGPCKAPKIHFEISGTIMAPESPLYWDGKDVSLWLEFRNVRGLRVYGFGTIDGRGSGWWAQSCRYHHHLVWSGSKTCTKLAPTALKFIWCNDSSLRNLLLRDSSQTHVLIRECNRFDVDKVVITSPGDSPNTDGIHIGASRQISISNSDIGSGDDCISMGDHISDIDIGNIKCGPGHGISIGSLGKSGNYVQVEKISVTNARFNRTTNGARIKTWQVGRGYVRNVKFQDLKFEFVKNPIIIDQNYCDVRGECKEQKTGVEISHVVYKEMHGTSSTEIAINLNCSKSVPCHGINLESIELKSAVDGKQVTAFCQSAFGKTKDVIPDSSCLLNWELL